MEMAKPQSQHEWLTQLAGEWTYETEVNAGPDQPPMKMTGTETVRAVGGLWIMAEGRGEMPGGGEATMVLTLGFDPAKEKFVGTWVGSMMTYLWNYTGSLNMAGTVLTLESEGPNCMAEGKLTRFKETMERVSDDHRVFSSSMLGDDGQWVPMMTCHYRRAK